MTAFTTIRTVGAALPADVLAATVSDAQLKGLTADDYHLEYGVTPREAANRAWSVLTGAWLGYREAIGKLPEADRAVGITREKWLAVVLRELGFGRVPTTPPGGLTADERTFPISHAYDLTIGRVPLHLLGWGVPLDVKTPGQPGAADRAPHAMVQEYLNRSDDALWAMVSNGRTLRLLRDSSTLIGQSYVEFDLESMFDGEVFSDFVVLYLVCHASRFEPDLRDDATMSDCWLERWRTYAADSGTRALQALSPGVKQAIEALGTGFLRHPANDLHHRLTDKSLKVEDFRESLLRLVYRLLFCFVAEDRGLLLDPAGDAVAKQRYAQWFSTARLRRIATRRRGSSYPDLWQALSLVLGGLGREGGRPELALPGLGGIFDLGEIDVVAEHQLANEPLLAALRHLTIVQPLGGGPKRVVDYRNLGAEELGSVYESLLEFVPRYETVSRSFTLESVSGNDRKTTGAYYTPTPLIDCLLDAALDPLLDEAEQSPQPEQALLELTVCDAACGSGHFLVAAAKRIAARLSRVRAGANGAGEPTIIDEQRAMHDVVDRCIYGVDLNPMAAELAKVSLWLESVQPGRPLSFLNAHIKVGNALLGTTPALLAAGIPDDAYTALAGDDSKWTTSLRRRNTAERDAGQDDLFSSAGIPVATGAFRSQLAEVEALPNASLADVHLATQRFREFDTSPQLRAARLVADAWCTAFVSRKNSDSPPITHSSLTRLRSASVIDLAGEQQPEALTTSEMALVRETGQQYRFFHWHLEFPQIFFVGDNPSDHGPGWSGGFTCIIGNPPWDTLSPDTREFFGELVSDIRSLSRVEKDARIDELLEHDAYRQLWETHQRKLFAIAHFLKRSGRYRMYAAGNLGKGDFNVYRSFAELALTFTAPGGLAGQVIQSGLYAGANSSEIRRVLIEECTWLVVYGFDNKGGSWFPGVTLENFAAYAARVGRPAPQGHEIRAAFGLPSPNTLPGDLAARSLTFPLDELRRQNPETLAIPDIRDPASARISNKLYRFWPPFGADTAGLPLRDFAAEIHMSDRNKVFSQDPTGVPMYEGRMIDFFDHRAKRYLSGHGNSSVWEETPFGSTRKVIWPQWHVAEADLPNDQTRARIRDYRIGFMDVADPGRQRSFVSALIPPGSVCGDKVPTVRFPDARWYTPVYLAVANSLVIDFLARQRVMGKKMALNILDGLPIARPTKSDPRCAWLAQRALVLTCTSSEMTPFWNQMAAEGWVDPVGVDDVPGECDPDLRAVLRAEIDAYVAKHVYDVSLGELELILGSFVQLEGIEVKRWAEYRTRRLVIAAYEGLA
ncbi:MAG: N-6 DNA methylase [Actinomycetota bacterium]|nr:N-6 DNA methylase [Actinomycetota bacterium]